jgi:DNA polymerase-1
MKRIVFDIETNGLDWTAPGFKVHCICTKDIDTGEKHSFYKSGIRDDDGVEYFEYLQSADLLIGHNIQFFDIPALEYYFNKTVPGKRYDTYVMASLMFSELDGHSLAKWGERLKLSKKTAFTYTDFSQCTPETIAQCERDVEITAMLFKHLEAQNWSQESIDLETAIATIIQKQVANGICFDSDKAIELYTNLIKRKEELKLSLREIFPTRIVAQEPVVPVRSTTYFVKGAVHTPIEIDVFEPDSDKQIRERMVEVYGWEPTVFTDKGSIKVDRATLEDLDYPAAELLTEYSVVSKLIGMVAEGKQAWLKSVKKGRIHGRVNTVGAVTGRMTHYEPNMTQVPSVEKPWGKECRVLFTASARHVLVGCDAANLEMRCLAHYLHPYDNGALTQLILSGDIHLHAAKIIFNDETLTKASKERTIAKKFIFAFIYGAQEKKLSSIMGVKESAMPAIMNKLYKAIPGIKLLVDDLTTLFYKRQRSDKVAWIKGIDGRKVTVRKRHAILNTLLQSLGALIMKKALIIADKQLSIINEFARPQLVLSVHDEWQFNVHPDMADDVGQILVESIKQAGIEFKLQCPLDGEYKIGQNWAETH